MKNPALADWLEHCLQFINFSQEQFGEAIFEGIVHVAATGQVDMLESMLSAEARKAAALGQELQPLNDSLQTVKMVIWGRLEEEIDPQLVWDKVMGLEVIFQFAQTTIFENYMNALQNVQRNQLIEITRQHQEAERKTIAYATELARANRELAKLEQAKTDFISIAGHELKTPLSVVQGYVNMLLEGNVDVISHSGETILRGIRNGTQRLTVMVDSMIDISAIETGTLPLKPESVSVKNIVDLLISRANKQTEARNLDIEGQIPADLPPIMADAKRFYQVLDQLLNNAIKYTPDSGKISLNVSLNDSPQEDIKHLKIQITDTGIGIAPEDIEEIFSKFYRVDEIQLHSSGQVKFKGAGPGLGLTLIRGIIEAMGGTVWAESPGYDEVNCPGSTFFVHLPVKLAPQDS